MTASRNQDSPRRPGRATGRRESLQPREKPKRRARGKPRLTKAAAARLDAIRHLIQERRRAVRAAAALRRRKPARRAKRRG